MQVNSVSSAQSFKALPLEARVLAAMDDNQIRSVAYKKAEHDVDDKKHRRIDSLMYYSIPLSSAFATTVNTQGLSRVARLGLGTKLAASLTLPFAAVMGAFGVKNQIDKHSRTSALFSANHPILTAITALAGGLLAAGAIRGGVSALAPKVMKHIDTTKLTESLAKKLDESKVLNFASKQLDKLPSSLKEFSKTALSWTPYIIIATQIGHMINHDRVKTNEYYKNYEALKTFQSVVRGA